MPINISLNHDRTGNLPAADKVVAPHDDDMGNEYLRSRDEAMSEGLKQLLRDHPDEQQPDRGRPFATKAEAETAYRNLRQSMGATPEEIENEMSNLPEPWFDPITVAASAGGMTGTLAVKSGASLLQALGRGVTSGVVSAAADLPIGVATELVGENHPDLALPFNLLTGLVSGATLERVIEKGVIKALTRRGITATPQKTAATVAAVRKNFETNQSDDITREVADDLLAAFGMAPRRPGVKASDASAEAAHTPLAEVLKDKKSGIASRLRQSFGDPSRPVVEIEAVPPDAAVKFLETDVHPLPEKAININFARIDTPDDIKEVIAKTAELTAPGIDAARRGVQANAETEALADNLGMTVEALLKRRKGEAFNAEQAVAARCLLVSSAEKLHELAETVSSGMASDFDKMAFRRQLSLHYAVQAQVSGMTAEAGRALQSFRIMASSIAEMKKTFDDLRVFESKNGYTVEDLANRLRAVSTVEGTTRAVRDAYKATTSDMLLEAWINGLLSNPVTHAVNTTSNALVALWQIPERLAAAGIGKMLGNNDIAARESVWQLYGMVNGLKDGFLMAKKVLATGEATGAFDLTSKLETNRYRAISSETLDLAGVPGRAVDLLGEAIRIPGRLLMAEDELFKSVGYRMELHALAYRHAAAEGLEGNDLARRITDIVTNPPGDLRMAAVNAANYQTFTKELGASGKKLQSFLNSHPALKVIVPFFRTPTNVFKYFGERTPLGLMSKNIRLDIAAGGSRRDLALSRMALGSTVMALSAYYTMQGKITGAGPADPKQRQMLRNTGWQPYSIKVGDRYYAYGRLEPLGTLLGIAADAAEIMTQLETGDIDYEKIPATALMAFSRNVTQKTFVRGVADLIEALEDPDRYGERYVQRLAGSVIPAGVAQAARLNDPVLREVNSVLDQIRSRIPGLSSSLPPRRNIWGEPIVLTGALGPDMISPIYTSEQKKDPVSDEMIRLRLPLSMPEKQIGGVELTPQEYDRYVQLAGAEAVDPRSGLGLKESLRRLFRDPEYRRQSDGPDGGKALLIKTQIHAFRTMARVRIMEEFPELRDLAEAARHEKFQAREPMY
jgi:hypothetical protein